MTTWRGLIEDALIELGVLTEGETAEQPAIDRGEKRLRGMLADWSIDGLLVPMAPEHLTWTMPAGSSAKTTFTVGPDTADDDPDIDTKRLVKLESVLYRPQGLEQWAPLTETSYDGILAEQCNCGTFPAWYHFEPDSPLSNLYLDSSPTDGDKLRVTGRSVYDADEIGIDDDIDLPVEYYTAILLNLAIEIAAGYGKTEKQLSKVTLALADRGKKNLKKRNIPPLNKKFDSRLMHRGLRRRGYAGTRNYH